MKSVRLKNFRCFHTEQEVPLAPLTLLVGNNSTGKTSFMALIHAMNGIMVGDHPSRSWGDPYDLGNFNQIANDAEDDDNTSRVEIGFGVELSSGNDLHCKFTLEPSEEAPFSVAGTLSFKDTWVSIEQKHDDSGFDILRFGAGNGAWSAPLPGPIDIAWPTHLLRTLHMVLTHWPEMVSPEPNTSSIAPNIDQDTFLSFRKLFEAHSFSRSSPTAPIRSKPLRTYDSIPSRPDPEGEHMPVFLAELSRNNKDAWEELKTSIQEFAKSAGLFDEIMIKDFDKDESGPFQLHVKEHLENKTQKGSFRNLKDVGYGVSQILPVVVELHRQKQTRMFLLQQPEVHLHPSAQAALGSFFCNFASWDQQLIVETHSDHLLDRVRMEVRDESSTLSPQDVLVLFFERVNSNVKIHPIRFDESGNVMDAPDTYRQFFLEEVNRSIGI